MFLEDRDEIIESELFKSSVFYSRGAIMEDSNPRQDMELQEDLDFFFINKIQGMD